MDHNLTTLPVPFSTLLGNLKCVIPLNQRAYAWSTGKVDDFIYDCLTERKLGRDFHFVGSILFAHKETASNSWSVEDGQQRLTTTLLMHKAVESSLREFKGILKTALKELDKKPSEGNEFFSQVCERLQLDPLHTKDILRALLPTGTRVFEKFETQLRDRYSIGTDAIRRYSRVEIEEPLIKEQFEHVMLGHTLSLSTASQVSCNYFKIKDYLCQLIDGQKGDDVVLQLLCEEQNSLDLPSWDEFERYFQDYFKHVVAIVECAERFKNSDDEDWDESKSVTQCVDGVSRQFEGLRLRMQRMKNLLVCVETATVVPVHLKQKQVNAMTVFLTTNQRGQGLVTFDVTKAVSIRHSETFRRSFSNFWLASVNECTAWGLSENKESEIIEGCFLAFFKGSSYSNWKDLEKGKCNDWYETWARREIARAGQEHVQQCMEDFSKFWPTYFRVAAALHSSKSRCELLQKMGAADFDEKWIESYCKRFNNFSRFGVVKDIAAAILLHYDWNDVMALYAALEIAITRVYVFEECRVDYHNKQWSEIAGFILHGGVPASELLEYIVEFTMASAPLNVVKEKLENTNEDRFKHWDQTNKGWGQMQFQYIFFELYNMLNDTNWHIDLTRTIGEKNPEIEHVLPAQYLAKKNATVKERFNKLKPKWQAQFQGPTGYQDWYVQTNDLGNLTLVPKRSNAAMSNNEYNLKRPELVALNDKLNNELAAIGKSNWSNVERKLWREKLVGWMCERWSFEVNGRNDKVIAQIRKVAGDKVDWLTEKTSATANWTQTDFEKKRNSWQMGCGELEVAPNRQYSI